MKEFVAKKPFMHWFASDDCISIKAGQSLNISEEFEDFYVIDIDHGYFRCPKNYLCTKEEYINILKQETIQEIENLQKKLKDLEEGKF